MRLLLFLISSFVILAVSANARTSDSSLQDNGDLGSGNLINNSGGISSGHANGYAMDDHGAIEFSSRSARMLFLEAQQNMRAGDSETALRKVKHSLAIDGDDMDAHCLYAELLDDKLRSQTDRDPTLFNQCVQEWLDILRNRYGDEKGMRFKGINPCGDLFNDEDRSISAKRALVKLTGYAPKTFETDNHYLKRVLMPTADKVAGTIVGSKSKSITQ